MLEITPEDIALLNDEQLRAVIARLCEAELRRHGFSTKHVTSGGNQNAADGGIDVRVSLPSNSLIDGFVPRATTGFQVKQQDMPPGEITLEMRPKGLLRGSIQELADQSGAYVIASSQGSTADPALNNRRDAMLNAVAGVSNADALFLDFYDRTRIATWVRSHEGLIPWVRRLIGRSVPGWQSYGAWAYAHDGIAAEYILDEKFRIHPVKQETERGLTAAEGIKQLRNELGQPRHVVRLVGLSGVGKTRLVQALFDERVGEESLDPALAIYTNMADEPDPQPVAMASDLVAAGTPAVLVVDNCPAELHSRLSETCRQNGSNVSVITVEYDIREDEPEGTAIFSLEPSSPELIQKLLRRRFQKVSQTDTHTIAEFSGGNARVAIALAATIEHNGTVAGLTDDQLFQRLFRQRHEHDESLYLIAQAAALLYSFHGEDLSESESGELVRLGRLIGKTPQDVYRGVAELQRRDLVQQRDVWRAMLPPAIANRLAKTALQNIPYTEIERHLLSGSSTRLLRSFSRRLGYLHTSKEALSIVSKWLGVNGLLANVAELNEYGRAMFKNVAPVAPEETLSALERVLLGQENTEAVKECKQYCDLLRSLAYEAQLFERSTALLVHIASSDDANPQAHSTQVLTSLFHLVLSGTHASVEQRAAVIEALVGSPDEKHRVLGVLALKALLEALHFGSVNSFEFGARSRDFGYWPRTPREVQHWFSVALKLTEDIARRDVPVGAQARAALAEKFRGLWLRAESTDEVARTCKAIGEVRFWSEGWLAVRQALDLDGKGFDQDRLAKLIELEAALRPANLIQKVRAVVFSTPWQTVDLDDYEDDGTEDRVTRTARTEALAQDLGKAVAKDDAILTELLPELVVTDGKLWSFGQGLAAGATDTREMWQRLVGALAANRDAVRSPLIFRGFLQQLRATDPVLASTLFDEAVELEPLAELYPYLQVAVDLDTHDIARLRRSMAIGKAPAAMYVHLAYGRATDPIPAPDLRELILAIAAMPSGFEVATEILQMRLHFDTGRKEGPAPELIDAGSELMQQLTFTNKINREDYKLGEISQSCMKGDKGAAVVTGTCQRLKSAVKKYDTNAFYHDDLLQGLFSAQPLAALNGLCGGDQNELEVGVEILRDLGNRKRPLAAVSDDDLLSWCDQDPIARYAAMARVITISEPAAENDPPRWTSLALRFLEKAPYPSAVLRGFVSQFMPASGWSGSLANILERNMALLDQLEAYPSLTTLVTDQKEQVRLWIESERRSETGRDRERDERFE